MDSDSATSGVSAISEPTPVVVVIGSTNTDLVVRTPALPRPGETALGGPVRRVLGGKGANQAVAARRAGATVYFIGCRGDDGFGDEAAAGLRGEGIRLDHLRVAPGAASGVALIAVAEETGENLILVSPGANGLLNERDIASAAPALAQARVVVAQLEVPPASVRAAFERARAHQALTVLNAAPAQAASAEILALTDLLVCNENEAETLTGLRATGVADAQAVVEALLRLGPKLAVLTLGGAGCLVAGGLPGIANSSSGDGDLATEPRLTPAFAVQVVDTTAAGDAFIGSLAYRLATGDPVDLAIEYATAAAALSTQTLGAQPSLPTALDVETFLVAHARTL